jgi:phospholipase/carboxylesterase
VKTIQTILEHRVVYPENSTAKTHPTLVMLHGRGADEEDLVGLSQYYDRRLLVLSVRAPFPFPGGGGYTWYDVGEVGTPEPAMFTASYDKLSQFFDDALKNYPIDPGRLFLLGFSMGTVMSFALSLTRPELFRGVMAYSGYVPERTHLTFQWQGLAHLEYFISHGTQDPVIPIDFARRTRELFRASNARVTYKEYPIGHQLSEEGLADSVLFFNRLLGNLQE